MNIKTILQKEAPDTPLELINRFKWKKQKIALKDISIDKEMWKKHSRSKLHQKRLLSILNAIDSGIELPPVILMHNNFWLIDGYTRVRAHLEKGKSEIYAVVGIDPRKKTYYKNNEMKLRDIIIN